MYRNTIKVALIKCNDLQSVFFAVFILTQEDLRFFFLCRFLSHRAACFRKKKWASWHWIFIFFYILKNKLKRSYLHILCNTNWCFSFLFFISFVNVFFLIRVNWFLRLTSFSACNKMISNLHLPLSFFFSTTNLEHSQAAMKFFFFSMKFRVVLLRRRRLEINSLLRT